MLYFLVPRRYRPLVLTAIGAVVLIVGIVLAARIPLVIRGLLLAGGIISGLGRLRHRGEDADDSYPGR